jgi:hypothetical protein
MLITCEEMENKNTFKYDLEFLKKHKETIVLKNGNEQCQVAIVPEYQGRVMSSTSKGLNGKSYGWINYDLISSGEIKAHTNAFGGEDRFWLGPEGGQYSIFFKKGSAFTIENWQTPKPIDSESFELLSQSDTHAIFSKKMHLDNYQGYQFEIDVVREISILDKNYIEESLDIKINEQISFLSFQSVNTIKNIGNTDWTREKGLLSIWILGMFRPSENTIVIIPYKDSLNLNTKYFGEIGSDRLRILNNNILFKGDGKYRCKIGLPTENATPFFGSYDRDNNVLTIVEYTFKGDSSYVNSLWENHQYPYKGDVINSYNDGPLENGEILGPFYELESSSPAKELESSESITHIHRTYHFEGNIKEVNEIAKRVLRIDLNDIVL